MAQFEKATVGEKVAGYVETRRKVLITVLVVVIVAIGAFALVTGITTSSAKKGISALDAISYALTENSSELSDEEIAARKETALASLEKYNVKGGVVGVRANMLSAEIVYSNKDYAKAAEFWIKAVAKGKKSYTAPICAFNAASSYENVNDLENAAKYYEIAGNAEDFLLVSRANFNLGRVLEANGKNEEAVKAYKKVTEKDPDSSWGKLSKTQLIKLGAE